ncbi:hypothetical protein WGH24286_00360 [Periweissella ghanensis]|uniref:Uncharacterized protein n=1 Tax=Periweissella ghanensis TaxID=467997 RepID=A0ABN8BLZ3_9LACO|nr:hypothetical protein WGH24286_00360 [Periweissella ghanensis]
MDELKFDLREMQSALMILKRYKIALNALFLLVSGLLI